MALLQEMAAGIVTTGKSNSIAYALDAGGPRSDQRRMVCRGMLSSSCEKCVTGTGSGIKYGADAGEVNGDSATRLSTLHINPAWVI